MISSTILSRYSLKHTFADSLGGSAIDNKTIRAASLMFLFPLFLLGFTGCGITVNPIPLLSITPSSLSWHKVAIGQTSAAQTITIANHATSPEKSAILHISSIEVTDNFIQTATTCPAAPITLGPGASCTISVAFRPLVTGALTGSVTVTDSLLSSPQVVPLTATGSTGSLLFDPVSLAFNGVAPNTISQPQTAKLTNELTTPVGIAAIIPSAHFAEGDNCPRSPNTLAAGESCSVTVTSNPLAAGSYNGAINVRDYLGNVTELYLSNSDQGSPIIGALSFSPATLQWGKVPVGSTSAAKDLTITNTQSGSVTFSAITPGPDYTITKSTCPASLGSGASCTLSLAFRPTTTGSFSELLTFTDNAANSPQAIPLKGTGALGNLLFAPTSLSFAGVDSGTVSPAQTATLTNVQAADVTITSITKSGFFDQTNNCPATLAPQASCTFTVTSNPTKDGPTTGSVNVKDSTGGYTQLYLKGQGGDTDKVLSFSPETLSWGKIAVGQTSGPKTLTVNNGQTVPLTIYSISAGQDFLLGKSTCPSAPETLAAGSSCAISLSFRPYSDGTKGESLTFTDDAPGGVQSVSLMGTGFIGSLLFNPTSLTFAGVDPNTASQPLTATLTNQQTSDLALSAFSISGHFTQTNDCPATLSPQASCTFTVTSNPTVNGPTTGSVNVKDGTGTTTQLYLFGMGGIPIATGSSQVSVAPQAIEAHNILVGQMSGSTAIMLSNPTSKPLALESISLGPNLVQTGTTCPATPSTLAAGAACKVSIAFRPTSAGEKTEHVTFKDDADSGTQTVTVTGKGVMGNLLYEPATLAFPPVTPGVVSSPQSVKLTNILSEPVALGSIRANGAFAQTNNCPTGTGTLSSGASCTISVVATPDAEGVFSGTVDAKQESGPVTQLYLTGIGSNAATGATSSSGAVSFSPASLIWGAVAVGQSSGAKSITLTNSQSAPLGIASIKTDQDFTLSGNTCPSAPNTLPAGGTCTLTVIFRPYSTGTKNEALTVTDDAAGSPHTASLSATGSSGTMMYSPSSLTFAAVPAGTSSPAKTAALTNQTSSPLTLTSISVTGSFAQTNNCPLSPATLAANASCTVSVTSHPSTSGTFTGALNTKNSSGTVVQLYLSGAGSGSNNGSNSVTVAPSSLTWGAISVGQSSGAKNITLTNGQSPLTISSVNTGTDFPVTGSTCPLAPATLAAGATCTLSVTFQPRSAGAISEALTITSDASNSPHTVFLNGTGRVGGLLFTPASISFVAVAPGTVSSSQAATLTNQSTSPIALTSIAASGHFAQTNTCPATLASQSSCTVNVTSKPTASGSYTGAVNAKDSSGNVYQLYLNGAGTGNGTENGGIVVFKPGTNLGFSPQVITRMSTPQTVTLTNDSSSALTISSITTTGSSAFGVSNTCIPNGQSFGSISPFSTCTISVTFDPPAVGSYTGSLQITDNATNSPQTISYFGTGVAGDTALAVYTTPLASCILPSSSQQFHAQVRNSTNTNVSWYVDNVLGGTTSAGRISTGGLYAGPVATGTHTVKAVSQANTAVASSTTISVTNTPQLAIYPFTSNLQPSGQQTFQGQLCSAPDNNSLTYIVDNIPGGNTSVGTVTNEGLYTAPAASGKHIVQVRDNTLNKTSGAVVNVYSGLTVDFGSRTNTQYPIAPGIVGVNHVDGLHNVTDMGMLSNAGIKISRTYALIPSVYATTTPNWTKIDPLIAALQQLGMHVILEMAFTPPWLQPNPNPCGAGNTTPMPTDINAWAQLAASYVAHMDSKFPGVVTDYEIWNEPDAGGLCGNVNRLTSYISLYAAAAPLMRQQATADGVSIRIGGPTTSGMNSTWIQTLLSTASTAPYVDFVSYHNYQLGRPSVGATWDTDENTSPSLFQQTQSPGGVAGLYAKASALVGAGKQPLGAKTPIYIDEYNTNWAYVQDCCRNDPTYSPIWNGLFVSDLLNTVYSGTTYLPTQLTYFAGNAYPYFCLIGTWDANMDCAYEQGSTPVPYPQFYTYQLITSSSYLGLNSGGHMAKSVIPGSSGGGLQMTAWYTASQDAVMIVNPTNANSSDITINLQNVGFTSPHAVFYRIVNGERIDSTPITLTQSGTGYLATVNVPAYSVAGITIQP